MQLIVLGMHRSGSSVLARMLNLMGAYFGPEGIGTGANKENPKGFWERRDVRSLNDYVLHAVGCDWNRVSGFDVDNLPVKVVAEFIKNATKLVLEMDAHRPWMLKEPRLCLLFPLWLRVLEIPVCVQILRNPVEVASSLRVRNGIPIKAGMALWEKYVRSALAVSSHLPRILVLHRQLMLEPEDAVKRLYADLLSKGVESLRMPMEREIGAFVDQALYRERDSNGNLRAYSNAPQIRLFNKLMHGKAGKTRFDAALTAASRHALFQYESSLPPKPPGPSEYTIEYTEVNVESKLQGIMQALDQNVKATRDLTEKFGQEIERPNQQGNSLERELNTVHMQVAGLESTLRQQIASLGKDMVGMLESEIKQWDDRRAVVEEELRVSRERVATLESQIEQDRVSLADVSGDLHAAQEAVSRLTTALKASESAKAEIERNLTERFREIAQLTRMLMDKSRELERFDTERRRLRKKEENNARENLRLKECIAAEAAKSARLERHLSEVTHSVAWRMTKPVRFLGQITRRRRKGSRLSKQDVRTIGGSGLFDTEWYLQRYPDVATSGMDPVEHYLRFGATEGRNPSVTFDTRFYLQTNVDVANSGVNPLLHFIRHGMAEGRLTQPKK